MIVTGCMGAEADKIRETHPGVLAVSGPHAYEEVVGSVHQYLPPKKITIPLSIWFHPKASN